MRKDFPLLTHHRQLTYLDTASSALTPHCVIDAIQEYYTQYGVNIARGLYAESIRATEAYEQAREYVATFLHTTPETIVFTGGTTDALSLLAQGIPEQKDDVIVATVSDHHANFVPWQQRAARNGTRFVPWHCNHNGHLRETVNTIPPDTTICALPHVSNVLGTENDLRDLCAAIRKRAPRAVIVVDAAQSAPHRPLHVETYGCDFLVFSGHKCYGPTGVGVLWGTSSALKTLTPLRTGGEMVRRVTCETSTFKEPPHGLEAGTPPIAQVIGLGAAVRYLQQLGMDAVAEHDRRCVAYALRVLRERLGNDGDIIGMPHEYERCGLISITLRGCHPHDVAHLLAEERIAVRAGTHCAQPLHDALGVNATLRLSFGLYTTPEDIDRAVNVLHRSIRRLRPPSP